MNSDEISKTFRALGIESEEDRDRFRKLAELSPKMVAPTCAYDTRNNTGNRDGDLE